MTELHDRALSRRGYLCFVRASVLGRVGIAPGAAVGWGRTPNASGLELPVSDGERVVMPWSKAPSAARDAATSAKLGEARERLARQWPREQLGVSGGTLYLIIPRPEAGTVAEVQAMLDLLPTRGYRARGRERFVEVVWLPEHAVGQLDRRTAGGRPKRGGQ